MSILEFNVKLTEVRNAYGDAPRTRIDRRLSNNMKKVVEAKFNELLLHLESNVAKRGG